jgi:hypothetical protein
MQYHMIVQLYALNDGGDAVRGDLSICQKK